MSEGCSSPPKETFVVRSAARADVSDVATMHGAAIDEGFLSTLGPAFLRRLYARILVSRHAFLLVAVPAPSAVVGSEPVVGFVAGALSVRGLYREFVLRDGIGAVVGAAPQLVRSVPRVLETLRYGTADEPGAGGEDARGVEAELLSMAVGSGARRRGIGASLVEGFKTTASQLGASRARVVVGEANTGAVSVYRAAGFDQARRFEVHTGTASLLLRTDLGAARGAEAP